MIMKHSNLSSVVSVRLQRLIRENADSLASSIVLEQGKTFQGQIHHRSWRLICLWNLQSDAHGDVTRGLQVAEHAASAPSLLLGEKIEGSFFLLLLRRFDVHVVLTQSAEIWILKFERCPWE